MSTETETSTTNTTAPVVKAPSKSSLASKIFDAELANRAAGKYETNRAFRRVVLDRMVAEVGVSMASASTIFNSCKEKATAANPEIGLGRDPKREKPVSATGTKRGRPAKAKATEVVTLVAETATAEAEAVAA